MQVINITDKERLNKFVGGEKQSQFLQSWQWGKFQEKVSDKIWRLGIEDKDKIVEAATIIKKQLPIGKNYFYCPRGPVGQATGLLFDEIKKIAKGERVMFLRFDPVLKITDYSVVRTIDVQPKKNLILDLSKGEEELLNNMHQKTRYNIRLAKKKGVKILKKGIDGLKKFWQLLGITSDRDKFRTHGRSYYNEMLKLDSNFITLFLAEYKNKIIAANVVSFFGDTVTYMHGASGPEHRNVMAPYLLQWQVIKLAKNKGYKYYDFYGIDEKKWPGVTRFKKGFGGEEINYPGTFDLIFDSSWYKVYKMVRKVRRTF